MTSEQACNKPTLPAASMLRILGAGLSVGTCHYLIVTDGAVDGARCLRAMRMS